MKKIIAITAMVAAAAGIAFAAEASVTARAHGSLFDYESTDGAKPKALTIDNTNTDHYEWAQTGLKFSFDGEKAGGSFVIDGHDSWIESTTVWFKPIEMLKISAGDQNSCTNVETIDWSKLYNVDTKGFGLSLSPIDGFSFDLIFGKDNYGSWLDASGEIGHVLAKASYGADFGTIIAVFGFKGETITGGVGQNDSNLVFGAGYSGNAGPVSFFADVDATIKPQATNAFDSVGVDAFATFAQDALTAKAYVKAVINPNATGNAKTDVGFKLKGEYNLGVVTPYLIVKSNDLIVDDGLIGLTVKPGFTASCGECAIDVGVEAVIKSAAATDFKFGIPVEFKVSF